MVFYQAYNINYENGILFAFLEDGRFIPAFSKDKDKKVSDFKYFEKLRHV